MMILASQSQTIRLGLPGQAACDFCLETETWVSGYSLPTPTFFFFNLCACLKSIPQKITLSSHSGSRYVLLPYYRDGFRDGTDTGKNELLLTI